METEIVNVQIEGRVTVENDHDHVQLCRPISAHTDGGQMHQTRRCASELNLVTAFEGADALPEILNLDGSSCRTMRDINMSQIKDVDQLAALGLRRLRFALQCRGAFCPSRHLMIVRMISISFCHMQLKLVVWRLDGGWQA
jgi:hypothetical protein